MNELRNGTPMAPKPSQGGQSGLSSGKDSSYDFGVAEAAAKRCRRRARWGGGQATQHPQDNEGAPWEPQSLMVACTPLLSFGDIAILQCRVPLLSSPVEVKRNRGRKTLDLLDTLPSTHAMASHFITATRFVFHFVVVALMSI